MARLPIERPAYLTELLEPLARREPFGEIVTGAAPYVVVILATEQIQIDSVRKNIDVLI
ncbi:MAG TPA: hypothetical protein GXX51_01660 [Firmicutes bacterium]|nr:hypothetical protein [Bacillota bacterium]